MTDNVTLAQLQQSIDELKKLATMGEKESLSLEEVSMVFDLKKSFLYALVHQRKIPFYKVGGGRLTFFKKSEVEAFLLANRVGTIDEAETAAVAYVAANPTTKKGGKK
jgi:excisionase family DNA binding protein